MTIRVSVVVPTRDRFDFLQRCLEALLHQTFDPRDYEIVVVDDGSDAPTRQQIQGWYQNHNSVMLSLPTIQLLSFPISRGPAAARNLGWQAAQGEIIAFTDDDCIPDRDWLTQGMAAFRPDVVGVSGQIEVPLPHLPTDYEYNTAQLAQAEFVTANCFYRRTAIDQVHGFDERFTVPWREDSDLFFSLLGQSGIFVTAPDAIVVHPIRPAHWGVSLFQQRKSFFNALLYRKHPMLYRQKLPPVTPWHYYRIVGAGLGAIGFAVAGAELGVLISLMLWLILTAQFCRKRLQRTSYHPAHMTEMIVTSILIPPLSLFWRLSGAFYFRVFFL